MDNSMGFMAVFAVSGGVVLLARQAHRRLLSEFMKKIECELGSKKSCHQNEVKKKVRFADDVIDPSSDNKNYRKKHLMKSITDISSNNDSNKWKCIDPMPVNRKILYKGIMEYKILKGLA